VIGEAHERDDAEKLAGADVMPVKQGGDRAVIAVL
jgi:hypothetical protein